MVVTAVGEQSRWGKTKAKLAAETAGQFRLHYYRSQCLTTINFNDFFCNEIETPLQEKLNVLAGQIGNGGMLAAGATFTAMLVIWFVMPEKRPPVNFNFCCCREKSVYLLKFYFFRISL